MAATSVDRSFAFGCSTTVFPADEVAILAQLGAWLEALAAGEIAPETTEDERLLKVDRGEAEPESLLERAWDRLKGRREYEREQATAPPPPEPQDYGMIEFDKDPCWW